MAVDPSLPAVIPTGTPVAAPSVRPMLPDVAADLAAWVANRDEAAFRRLVDLHVGLVRGVCRRQLGDGDDADEAAQAVFIVLARRAGTVSNPGALPSWLYATAQRVCHHARRAAMRRSRHERTAAMHAADDQRLAADADDGSWIEARPLLDDAISSLGRTEREVVIRHFLHGHTQAAVALSLGVSESAVSKRVSGAVVKLRAWFARRRVAIGAVALASGMSAEAAAAEPALAASCAQAALHPATAAGASALAAGSGIVLSTKLIAVTALAGATLVGTAVAMTPSARAVPAPTSATSTVVAPAIPASAPVVVVLRHDFEYGLRPVSVRDGEVTAGPAREGSRFCLSAVLKAHGSAEKHEVVLVDRDMALATCSDGMRLRFACHVTGASDVIHIWMWNFTQGGNARIAVPMPPVNGWTRIEVAFADFRSEDGTRAGFATGDRIGNLAISIPAHGPGSLCIDDLELTRPP